MTLIFGLPKFKEDSIIYADNPRIVETPQGNVVAVQIYENHGSQHYSFSGHGSRRGGIEEYTVVHGYFVWKLDPTPDGRERFIINPVQDTLEKIEIGHILEENGYGGVTLFW